MNERVMAGWRIKPGENRIYRRGRAVDLQPRCMNLLVYLARSPGRVVSRRELFDQVWDGRIVGEDALNNCVKKLRRALDDDPRRPRIIETVNGRGYRLVAQVRRPLSARWGRRAWLGGGFIGVLLVLLGAVHGNVSVYHFSESDTPEQTREKLGRMNGEIVQDEGDRHALSVRLHGDRNQD